MDSNACSFLAVELLNDILVKFTHDVLSTEELRYILSLTINDASFVVLSPHLIIEAKACLFSFIVFESGASYRGNLGMDNSSEIIEFL